VARTESQTLEAIAVESEAVDAARTVGDAVRVRRWALVAAVLLLSALATWFISPRFAIDSPSLVDDWSAIAESPDQVADLIRLENPEEERFRPSWILWNYVQWHTLDGPYGLVGPNAWNLLRTFLLVAGLVLATALALPRPKSRVEALVHAALAATPAFMVLAVPKFAPELARFGPQEPLLLGWIALGGSLLVLAVRSLLDDRTVPAWRIVALGLAGSVFWILGVYQKEVSLAVLPLVAATLFAGRRRLTRWPTLARGRRVALGAIGAVVVLPLAHVAIESARIAWRGDLVYGAEVDDGRGIWLGLVALYDWLHEVFPLAVLKMTLGALVVVVLVTIVVRRVDVLALGALAAGGLTLVFAAQSGTVANRYYIPAFALAVSALSISLARLPVVVQVAGLATLALAVYPYASLPRAEVQVWADKQHAAGAFVRQVADVRATGCPVAVAGLDTETHQALPVLVAWEQRRLNGACTGGETYLVLRSGADATALAAACAEGALEPVLEPLREDPAAGVYRCSRLRTEPVRDPTHGVLPPERLVELRLLRPS
jgi:hypothetical protein